MRTSDFASTTDSRLTALLGPTNTGKTHFAIEQMASYASGVIGFPLRLLARENYERLVALKGPDAVALVTGEEKIVPARAQYFSCTVEAMPLDRDYEFVGVDEIHLCADPERGHIFTERLLHARGVQQTMFMGAETIRPLLLALIPKIEFIARPRLSQLSYTGFKKMTRLPKRSAVVAFSVDDVYAIAEMIRRQRGGTAVVLGALSPRTRNKQVEMYQSGEVDFLVATDAIGMGLNMDIHHVALAATRKFDGQVLRELSRAEMAQIAGRAGRHLRNGTFGVTGRVDGLDAETVTAIEQHEFEPLTALCWRNNVLDFGSPARLLASLEKFSGSALLARGQPADDVQALTALMTRDDIMVRASDAKAVELLWEVCQIPDFRKTLAESHQELITATYISLIDEGVLPEERVRASIEQLNRIDGDVDTLMTRIAHIRTWTYITHKSEWLRHPGTWAEMARGVEDRLSDALHEALTKRFVDRRSAVLLRAMEGGKKLLAGMRHDGEVVVEGHVVGRLDGFRFVAEADTGGADYKAVMAAARSALRPEMARRITKMLNAEAKQFKIDPSGAVLFQTDASNPLPGEKVAQVRRGQGLLQPEIELVDSNLLDGVDKTAVADKIRDWLKAHIATVLEPLLALNDEENLSGHARGIAFQLYESLGIIPRATVAEMITGLDEAGRASLRQKKVRLGPVLVFLPGLNKPGQVRLRALLWTLWRGKELPASVPNDGVTSVALPEGSVIDPDYYRAIGYPVYANRAIRVDMLDRLISAVYDSAKDGKFQATHSMAEWLGSSVQGLYDVLTVMGHTKIEEEPKPEHQKPEESNVDIATLAAAEAAEAPATILENKDPTVRPTLATFQLRRGKAYGEQTTEKRAHKPWQKKSPTVDKPVEKIAHKARETHRPKRDDRTPRDLPEKVISARPQEKGESPFAALQNLKFKSKDGS